MINTNLNKKDKYTYIIIHRVNTIEKLKKIPKKYGVEIDVRGYGDKLFLNHDPIDDPKKYVELDEYLKHYNNSLIIFNTKEAGYEQKIVDLAKKYKIENYFLLDVEFPYLYRATRKEGIRSIAVRYSETEPIEAVEAQIIDGKTLLNWVWIDTNTKLPLDKNIIKRLKPFKTCLVCPERWGRPEDISKYINQMKKLNFKPDAVMTSIDYVKEWEKW